MEQRVLLAATVINPVGEVNTPEDTPTSVDLSQVFDDPDFTGSLVLFDTVPIAVDDNQDGVTDRFVEDYIAELFDDLVPGTVNNFLNYANNTATNGGNFVNNFVHRSIPGFVIQLGAFFEDPNDGVFTAIDVPTDAPIVNEFANHAILDGIEAETVGGTGTVQLPAGTDLSQVAIGNRIRLIGVDEGLFEPGSTVTLLDFYEISAIDDANDTLTVIRRTPDANADPVPIVFTQSFVDIDWFIIPDVNVRGTLSPPKQAGNPDSATSGVFVNLDNNADNLDIQNQGFAAFGRVRPQDLPVVDAIAALSRVNAGGAFTTLPVNNFDFTLNDRDDLVLFNNITQIPELTVQIVNNSNPGLGTVVLIDGEVQFTPDLNETGSTEVTVRATDIDGNFVEDTITFTVDPMDDPLVTQPDEDSVFQDTPITIDVLNNDSDVDNIIDPTTVTIVDQPDNGDVEVDPVTGEVTYTPDPGFVGQDTFTYTVENDAQIVSDETLVTVNVIDENSLGVADQQNRFEATIGGVDVTIQLRGEGQAEVFDIGQDRVDLVMTGTSGSTNLTITTRGGELNVRNITADGSVKSIQGRTTNIVDEGDVIIAGTIGQLTLNNVAANHLFMFGPRDSDRDAVRITLNLVSDLTIMSDTPINQLTVTDWQDTDEEADLIKAPSIGRLQLRGDRRNDDINGDFPVSLMLDGSDGARQTLANVSIAGDVDDDTLINWDITGDVGTVRIDGLIDGFRMTVASEVRSMRLGSLVDAEFDLDELGTFQAIEWNVGELNANSARTIRTTGVRNGPVGHANNVTFNIGQPGNDGTAISTASFAGGAFNTAFNVNGDVNRLDFKGDLSGVNVVIMSELKNFRAGEADSLNIQADVVGNVQLTDWEGGSLTADSARSIQTRGDRGSDNPGNMSNVTVTLNDPTARQVFSTIRAGGGVENNLTLNITGEGGTLDIRGPIDQIDAVINGSLRTARFGVITTGNLTAGNVSTLQAVSWEDGEIELVTLRNLKTTGNRDGDPGNFGPDMTIIGVGDDSTILNSANIKGTLLASVWRVDGSSGNLTFNAVATGADTAFDGELRGVNVREDYGGIFCATSMGRLSVGGSMVAGVFLAGIGFGPDGIFQTADDPPLLGGDGAAIKSIRVGGTIPGGVVFTAGLFPRSANINGTNVDPLTSPSFALTPA